MSALMTGEMLENETGVCDMCGAHEEGGAEFHTRFAICGDCEDSDKRDEFMDKYGLRCLCSEDDCWCDNAFGDENTGNPGVHPCRNCPKLINGDEKWRRCSGDNCNSILCWDCVLSGEEPDFEEQDGQCYYCVGCSAGDDDLCPTCTKHYDLCLTCECPDDAKCLKLCEQMNDGKCPHYEYAE